MQQIQIDCYRQCLHFCADFSFSNFIEMTIARKHSKYSIYRKQLFTYLFKDNTFNVPWLHLNTLVSAVLFWFTHYTVIKFTEQIEFYHKEGKKVFLKLYNLKGLLSMRHMEVLESVMQHHHLEYTTWIRLGMWITVVFHG